MIVPDDGRYTGRRYQLSVIEVTLAVSFHMGTVYETEKYIAPKFFTESLQSNFF